MVPNDWAQPGSSGYIVQRHFVVLPLIYRHLPVSFQISKPVPIQFWPFRGRRQGEWPLFASGRNNDRHFLLSDPEIVYLLVRQLPCTAKVQKICTRQRIFVLSGMATVYPTDLFFGQWPLWTLLVGSILSLEKNCTWHWNCYEEGIKISNFY